MSSPGRARLGTTSRIWMTSSPNPGSWPSSRTSSRSASSSQAGRVLASSSRSSCRVIRCTDLSMARPQPPHPGNDTHQTLGARFCPSPASERRRQMQKLPEASRCKPRRGGRPSSVGWLYQPRRGSALDLFSNCHPFSLIELPESSSATYDDRLLAALIHHDGGAVRVKCVLEECEVERAPEQRAAQGHHSLDHGTRRASVA